MFRNAIARLLRCGWGATPHFDNRKPEEIDANVLRLQAVDLAARLQQLVEEIATLGANSESYDSVVPVKVDVAGENYNPPDIYLADITAGNTLFALEVNNPSSFTVEKDDETIVRNGLALNAVGTSNFQQAVQRDFHTNTGESITNYSILVDNQQIQNLLQINNNLWVKNAGQVKLGDFIVWDNGVWYGGSTATYGKVKLSTASDTAKYLRLHFADYTTAAYNATNDYLVKFNVVSGQLRAFVDVSDFTNFVAANNQALGHLANAGPKMLDLSTNCSTA